MKIYFSIITPSLNQSQYLEKTIKSIQRQTYKNFEHIVVDGGSTDGTIEILKKYSNKIKWISEKDKGQTNAINKGLKMAKGEIVAYLNSDDLYEKDTLETVVNFFSKNSKAMIVYGKAKFIDEKGRFLGYYETQEPTLKNLFKECVISQPTVFFRKKLLEEIGYFDESLNYVMDYDYWIRVAKKYRFYFIDKVLAATRLHKDTKTSKDKIKVFEEILKVLKKNYGKVSDEAVFNYVYLLDDNPKGIIKEAIKIYKKYHQMPGLVGIRYFFIFLKQAFLKKK